MSVPVRPTNVSAKHVDDKCVMSAWRTDEGRKQLMYFVGWNSKENRNENQILS